ncbi:MAG: radical SAM protein [Elusimicrobiota bacterium]
MPPTAAGYQGNSILMSSEQRVEIKLGDLCNNRCVFCVSGGRREAKAPWAPLGSVREELSFYRARGCRCVGFLGGEPTVYPWIEEAVRYARDLGYGRIALCTNGARLASRSFCERLVSAGLTRVTVSLHSHRPEIEDGPITGVPGNHSRKVAGIRNLLSWRERGKIADGISLNPVLNRRNLMEMSEYLSFAKGLGVTDVRFNYIWPEHRARGSREWVPSLREAAPRIVRAILLNRRLFRLRLSFGGVPRCVLGWSGASPRLIRSLERHLDERALDPDNDVSVPSGDAGRGERFVWQERKKESLKKRGPRCGECRHATTCEGVWRTYADIYGLDELVPAAERAP